MDTWKMDFGKLVSTLDSIPIYGKVVAAVVCGAYLSHGLYFSGGRNPYNKQQLKGKIAIVTGGNTGIGYKTAMMLARNGAEVVLACRDSPKTKRAVESIKQASGNAKISAEALELDSLDSVRQFAVRWKESKRAIHFLINNAGILMLQKRGTTRDGFEMQFGVNHLGHFLLTNLLIDTIKSTAVNDPVRIVNVSSEMSERGVMDWDDLMKSEPGKYDPIEVYAQSKLANVLFMVELQRILTQECPKSDILVTCLHPGAVRTELGRHILDGRPIASALLFSVLYPLYVTVLKSPWEGAQTTLYCALAPSRELIAGAYYADCAPKRHPQDVARDLQAAKKLWAVSKELTHSEQL